MVSQNKLIPSLNGLRAICILIVVFSHGHIFGDIFHQITPLLIFENGGFGVNFFFVISGFLITKLLADEEKKYGKISLINFYKRRALRIFPAYYFLLLVYFILQKNQLIFLSGHSWLSALTYTKYFNHSLDVYSAHLWSLSVEEHFYLFWPIVFVFLPSKRTTVLLLFIIVVPFVRLYGYNHTLSFVEIDTYTLFQRADSLAFGCLLALHYEKFYLYFNRLFKAVKFPLLFIFILLSLIFILDEVNRVHQLHLGIITLSILGCSGTITILCILMLIVYSIDYTNGWWFKFLNSQVMDHIGRLSYSIYLWQQILIFGPFGVFSQRPYCLITIFVVASSSYYFIERPFLSLKNRFTPSFNSSSPDAKGYKWKISDVLRGR